MSIGIEAFTESLERRGASFYTGVPCSYLQSFVSYAASGKIRYYAAASEGEAIGMAAGAYLGGNFGTVLIQNSGLGNCVNPLTSLALTFEIPLLLIVSHRGAGGKDAPQHQLMGEIIYDLLRVMGVSAHTVPDDTAAAIETLDRSLDEALSKRRPVALVAPKGIFEAYAGGTSSRQSDRPGSRSRPPTRAKHGWCRGSRPCAPSGRDSTAKTW